MSGFIGSDPEELRSLAKHMDGGADQLDGLREQLGGRFQSVRWDGADAQRAKGEFRMVHARKIAQAAVMLRDTAELVRKDAQEQTTISSEGGSGTGHSGLEIAKALPLFIDADDLQGAPGSESGPGAKPFDFELAKALPLIIDADDLPELPDETGGRFTPPIARAIPLEIPFAGPVAEALPGRLNVEDAPEFREPAHTLPARVNIDDVPGLREKLEDLGQPPVYEAYSGPEPK